ncbi:hypothetical protein [Listeria rocourtiae]|uniref:hypothetical protein n=1 Tax=Listeria rocourtiae TaxID=647910 RepID=UPI003D2F97C1
MKKTIIKAIAILSFLTIFTAGCAQTPTDKVVQAEKNKIYEQGQTVDVSGLDINMKDAKLLDGDGKKDAVVQFNMKVRNGSADAKVFTSLDVTVKNEDGKELPIYAAENIGSNLKADQTISGPGFYQVKGKGPFQVTYTDPDTKKSATWKVKLED